MDELKALYQEVILDHSKRPRNWGKPERYNRDAEGYNPLCGDRVHVYLTVENDTVCDAHADGTGCAICTASTSMMTEAVRGKTVEQIEALFQKFQRACTGQATEHEGEPKLDKLAVFVGVADYPARVKCATLAWHTVHAAVEGQQGTITTE
jgi:nitrogen fixation NifU-like protein